MKNKMIISDSLKISLAIIGFVSTIMTICGFSICDVVKDINILCRIVIVLALACVLSLIVMLIIYAAITWNKCINIKVDKNNVTIACGDIFKETGLKVIGFNSTFISDPEKIDDRMILKSSLHGQLVLKNENHKLIKNAVLDYANGNGAVKNSSGEYDFPLGTVIPVKIKDEDYRLLALSKLNKNYESHTDSVEYMCMLMNMWKNLHKNYAMKDIVIPVLGAGITRFDSGKDEPIELIRCILHALAYSDIHFKSKIKIVIYDAADYKPCDIYSLKHIDS